MDYKAVYDRWLATIEAKDDIVGKDELLDELRSMNEEAVEDAFYRDLAFGTGGLRGTIGAGTNRMNVLTVAKASQGLANYLLKNYERPSVVIGFDSRLKSDIFAQEAAAVFAANGINVWAWNRLLPVPTVSYATRYIGASAGVMITASHNPSKYNGYKVYGSDGCQITTEAAAEILAEIEKIDIFSDVKRKNKLYKFCYTNLYDSIKKYSSGKEKEALLDMFDRIMDYMNFVRVYRLKQYYHEDAQTTRRFMFPFGTFDAKTIEALCSADSGKEVFDAVKNTKFGKALEKLDYVYKGEIDNIGLYKTTLKNMYFSTYPLVVMLSYVFVMQTEYNNIVSIIEGVRYNVDPSKIKTLIIT